MRIAQVSPLFESVPPRLYGGTERVVHWLTEALVAQGHDVTLFASGDSQTSARLVAACPEALRLARCKDQLAAHVLLPELVYAMVQEFDIIHWHVDYFHFQATRRQKFPHLTTLHGRLDLPELNPVYRYYADLPLVSISDFQRRPLPFAHWVGTVHHGMPQETYSPVYTRGQYLAFLGRFSPEKRPDRAIEIARRSGVPLKMAAKIDDSDRAYFEEVVRPLLKQPGIEYLGEIGDKDKNEFLGNAMALLFPIDWPEPFGLVMIEAMACGTPVIAWPGGSVPEVLTGGLSGCIVESIDAAVKAVERVAGWSRRQVRAAFDARFTSDRMARDYCALYQRMLEPQPQPVSGFSLPRSRSLSGSGAVGVGAPLLGTADGHVL